MAIIELVDRDRDAKRIDIKKKSPDSSKKEEAELKTKTNIKK